MKLNIPNMISLFRILLIPVFLVVFLGADSQREYYLAALLLLISGISDTLDGMIARRFNMITQLGKVLDPIADKLTLAAVIAGVWIKWPSLGLFCLILVIKELLMLVGGIILFKSKTEVQGAEWFGKLATVLFYVIMIIIVAWPALPIEALTIMLIVLVLFMLFALVRYIIVFFKLRSKQ